MPQARSGRSSSSGGSSRRKTGGGSSSSARSKSSSRSTSGSRSKSSSRSSGGSRGSGSTRSGRSASSTRSTRSSTSSRTGAAGTAEARVEAVAQRLRKLNERIITAGREAGETTLTSYERALKAIASTLEKGPGSSDVNWVADLATAQAKFIRDLTNSWTKAARKMLR